MMVAMAAGFAGCKGGINVNLETPEPIKVDITMKVQVEKVDDLLMEEEVPMNLQAVRKRLGDRGAEIQTLKDNRIVGEEHKGLLDIRSPPAGDYGDYVKKTVADENADRLFLMAYDADDSGETLEAVQRREGEQRASASFEGEWIEVAGEKSGDYRWAKKKR